MTKTDDNSQSKTIASPRRSCSLSPADTSPLSGWKRPWMSQVDFELLFCLRKKTWAFSSLFFSFICLLDMIFYLFVLTTCSSIFLTFSFFHLSSYFVIHSLLIPPNTDNLHLTMTIPIDNNLIKTVTMTCQTSSAVLISSMRPQVITMAQFILKYFATLVIKQFVVLVENLHFNWIPFLEKKNKYIFCYIFAFLFQITHIW